jgi:hypothetical protein
MTLHRVRPIQQSYIRTLALPRDHDDFQASQLPSLRFRRSRDRAGQAKENFGAALDRYQRDTAAERGVITRGPRTAREELEPRLPPHPTHRSLATGARRV